jgi:hypothetical protein
MSIDRHFTNREGLISRRAESSATPLWEPKISQLGIMWNEMLKVWTEVFLLSSNLNGVIEENHENLESGQSVARPGFEPVTFREQVTILATYARFVVKRTLPCFSTVGRSLHWQAIEVRRFILPHRHTDVDGQGLLKHLRSQETPPVRLEYQVNVGELTICGQSSWSLPSKMGC